MNYRAVLSTKTPTNPESRETLGTGELHVYATHSLVSHRSLSIIQHVNYHTPVTSADASARLDTSRQRSSRRGRAASSSAERGGARLSGSFALSFGDVASAVGGTLRTSLGPDELAETVNVIGGETAIVESVGLVPPLISVRRPDLDEMAKIMGAVREALTTGVPSGF